MRASLLYSIEHFGNQWQSQNGVPSVELICEVFISEQTSVFDASRMCLPGGKQNDRGGSTTRTFPTKQDRISRIPMHSRRR